MSSSIGFKRPVFDRAGSAPGADNDRRLAQRQARHRPLQPAVGLGLFLALASASPVVAEDDATGRAPLEMQRQQIDGRLGTIERRQEDLGRPPPAAGSRLDPYEPAARPGESRGARNRLDLERRTLEGRRNSIDRDLERRDRGTTPSTRGLLDRLRRD
jgi:hypothetical protein